MVLPKIHTLTALMIVSLATLFLQPCRIQAADYTIGTGGQEIMNSSKNKIPVILDTDIGGDIDDTWALAVMLKSPELDVKLITSTTPDTVGRARIIAKMLTLSGRMEIPIGIGLGTSEENYDFSPYKGIVHKDGVQAIIDTVTKSHRPITLICIGPLTNIAEAISRKPEITRKIRFVGMQGSVYRGYYNSETPGAEYNIATDIAAAKKVFAAHWKSFVITPLDTCGIALLDRDKYRIVRESKDPLTRFVIDSYENGKPAEVSSVLYDTVAIYLSFSHKLVNMRTIGIRVTDDGCLKPDDNGNPVNCALSWKNLPAFSDFLVERLTRSSVSEFK